LATLNATLWIPTAAFSISNGNSTSSSGSISKISAFYSSNRRNQAFGLAKIDKKQYVHWNAFKKPASNHGKDHSKAGKSGKEILLRYGFANAETASETPRLLFFNGKPETGNVF
jgi:hypothetical protein